MSEPKSQKAEIFVVSDGTGDTAMAAVQAVMLQFQVEWSVRTFVGVRYESEIRLIAEAV